MQKYATRGDDNIGQNVPCAGAAPQETAPQTRADVAEYTIGPSSSPADIPPAERRDHRPPEH
jgi:hypothetical protein